MKTQRNTTQRRGEDTEEHNTERRGEDTEEHNRDVVKTQRNTTET